MSPPGGTLAVLNPRTPISRLAAWATLLTVWGILTAATPATRQALAGNELRTRDDLLTYIGVLDAAWGDTVHHEWLTFEVYDRGYEAARGLGDDSLTAALALRTATFVDRLGPDSGLPLIPFALEAVTLGEGSLSGKELAKAYGMLGRASTNLGDYASAATYFKRTLELAEVHEPEAVIYPLRRLARVCLQLRDTACAETAMEQALTNDAARDRTWRAMYLIQINRRLVEIYAARGQWARVDSSFAVAEEAWQDVRDDPDQRHFSAELRPAQVRCELMRGDVAAANAYVDSLALTHPNFARIHRSFVQAARGDSTAAYRTFRAVEFGAPSDRVDYLPHAIALARAAGDLPAALAYSAELRGVLERRTQRLQESAGSLTEAKLAGMVRERTLEAARARADLASAKRSSRLKQAALMAAVLLLTLVWLWRRQRRTARERAELERRVAQQTAELAAANRALERSNAELNGRVDELARFNFLLSHDLREPVRSVVSFAELAERHVDHPDRLADDLAFVVAGARQLGDLLEGIEAMRAVDERVPSLARFDAVATLRDCMVIARHATPDARLSLSASTPSRCEVRSDVAGVGRIVSQLIDNAIRFAGDCPAEVVVDLQIEGEEAVVRVLDSGLGFDFELREDVFAAFKRMHRREEFAGAGVGLTVSRRLAESLGGSLSCTRAQEGLGCTFEFRFLRWAQEAAALSERAAAAA